MREGALKSLVEDAEKFNRIYDGQWEDDADMQRREFLKRFPVKSLPSLTLGNYAIGQNKGGTFCHWAEPGTDKWARSTGATASKFGVYFGFAGKGSEERYRYTKKFAGDLPLEGAQTKVFRNIQAQLLGLVERGHALDFISVEKRRASVTSSTWLHMTRLGSRTTA